MPKEIWSSGRSVIRSAKTHGSIDDVTEANPNESGYGRYGLEALNSSSEFRGRIEPLGDHDHVNTSDYFRLIYASREEPFAAAIPVLCQDSTAGTASPHHVCQEGGCGLISNQEKNRGSIHASRSSPP